MMEIPITRLSHGDELNLPAYATEHAAGMDLRAAVKDYVTLPPGKTALIPTGIAIAVPVGFEAQIRPRSGLALKHSIGILNSPATIDADYRGEIGVVLCNHGDQSFVVNRADRIAQMVITPCIRVEWMPVDDLPETARGTGGFGSTGTRS